MNEMMTDATARRAVSLAHADRWTWRPPVDAAIDDGIDHDAWGRCEKAEQAELGSLNDVLSAWQEAAG